MKLSARASGCLLPWLALASPWLALASLTAGCATTAAKPAAAPAASTAAAGSGATNVKTHVVTAEERAAMTRIVVTVSTGQLPVPESGPQPVVYDIGEDCLEDRYSEQSHCAGNVPLEDCQAATSEGKCGIKEPFTLTNVWCAEVDSDEAQKWHVFCQGYVPSGAYPTPQCPDGHVLGVWGQECEASCTRFCGHGCNGGYCVDGAFNLCYDEYQPECDCGIQKCPCTGPDC